VEKYGTAGQATDGNIIRRMRFACWITKATDTHSECVTFIAFPLQQWLRERTSLLRYTYTVSCTAALSISHYMASDDDSLLLNWEGEGRKRSSSEVIPDALSKTAERLRQFVFL
jgi:hypothetical protein